MRPLGHRIGKISPRDLILSYGFYIVLIVVLIAFSLASRNFATLANLISLMHTAAPTLILASGLALVVMTGALDISVGTVAFLSAAIGSLLMVRFHWSPVFALPLILVVGAVCGGLNAFIVTVLRVNPLIATLGTMIGLRGIAYEMTKAQFIPIPESLGNLHGITIGPVYLDTLIALGVVTLVHFLHTRTAFGRHIMAIGNGKDVAGRLGIRVDRTTAAAFVLSGLFASFGGIFTMLQVGYVEARMGQGMEFTAIACIVIGGISLFGGIGSLMPGLVVGVFTLAVIENGLQHVAASVFAYPFVRGGIILAAMYADTLKSVVRTQLKLVEHRSEPSGAVNS